VIDECVTGSYHRNSLEGLAAGCVVVNGVGLRPAIAEVLRRCAGGAASPFVFARLDELEQELENLISLGPAALALRGVFSRHWMEQNWQFQEQWDSCWTSVVHSAFTRVACESADEGRRRSPSGAPVPTECSHQVDLS
jgi:hypothetical protein